MKKELTSIEIERKFYRETLEQICWDTRNTRAKRLAESALCFWDQMQKEKSKKLFETKEGM